MVKLGVSDTQAKSLVATQTSVAKASNNTDPNKLSIADSFDVAWRRVGVALDRTGFTVEDRDRAQGIYFVRYVDSSNKEEKGFFSNLFSSAKPDAGPQKYRVWVINSGGKSEVTVQNATGQQENSPIAQRILKLLADDLR
jgi:outer membrane protein assembly factor BamC